MASDYIAPTLLVGFGLLGAVMSAWELTRLWDNPEPVAVACDAAAIEGTPDDRWIVVQGCELSLDDIFEVERDDEIEELLIPLRRPDAAADERPVALLALSDASLVGAYEELPAPGEPDAQAEEATREFLSRLDATRIEGVTSSRYGETGDPRFDLLRQRYTLPPDGLVSIERNRVPKLSVVIVAAVAALVLLPLGIVFFLRERRQPPAAEPSLPPGLPRP